MNKELVKTTDGFGTITYRLNGELHRTDGPAIEYKNGGKQWWVNGLLHRIDGPAIEYPDGYKEWWKEGVRYTEEGFKDKIEG